ncbi:MAG: hypothetical protein KGI98_09225 [Euryarchaeota archaeon]|nr:hypothetical protein [Euryarchaeota archaeon]MDE1879198.1 hypothetical protein [Euryarchaeota archaeon]
MPKKAPPSKGRSSSKGAPVPRVSPAASLPTALPPPQPELAVLPQASHIPLQGPANGETEYKMMGRYRVRRETWNLFHQAMSRRFGSPHGHTNDCLDMALEQWSRSMLAAQNAWL